MIPLETMEKLVQLATDGATIVFHQHLPNDVPGMFNLAERKQMLKAMVDKFSFTPAGEAVQKAAIGRGMFLLSNNLEALMAAAKIHRESLVDKGLQYNRRSYKGGH